MCVLTSIMTKREAIAWELLDSKTHQGGVRWVAQVLGIPEMEVFELLRSAEEKIREEFGHIHAYAETIPSLDKVR